MFSHSIIEYIFTFNNYNDVGCDITLRRNESLRRSVIVV